MTGNYAKDDRRVKMPVHTEKMNENIRRLHEIVDTLDDREQKVVLRFMQRIKEG